MAAVTGSQVNGLTPAESSGVTNNMEEKKNSVPALTVQKVISEVKPAIIGNNDILVEYILLFKVFSNKKVNKQLEESPDNGSELFTDQTQPGSANGESKAVVHSENSSEKAENLVDSNSDAEPVEKVMGKILEHLKTESYSNRVEELKLMAKWSLEKIVPVLKCDGLVTDHHGLAMKRLRMLFADPIDDKFFVKLSQSDFEELLSLGIEANVPELVSNVILQYDRTNIKPETDVTLLVDAFWVLTNISSGQTRHTVNVISTGIIPFAMYIVEHCDVIELVNQCVMLISNVIVDDANILDQVVTGGVYARLHSVFPVAPVDCKAQILHLYYSLVKSAIKLTCTFEMIHQGMSILKPDTPVSLLTPVLQLVNEATRNSLFLRDFISMFNTFGYTTNLALYLSHRDVTIQTKCLMALGNLLLGDDDETWPALKTTLLQNLKNLLHSEDNETVKQALWILSNVAAGESAMAESFFEYDYLPQVLHYIVCGDNKLVNEAFWALSNLFTTLTQKQFETRLTHHSQLVKTFETFLGSSGNSVEDNDINKNISHTLDILTNLFKCIGKMEDASKKEEIRKLYSSSDIVKCLNVIKTKELDDLEIPNRIDDFLQDYEEMTRSDIESQ